MKLYGVGQEAGNGETHRNFIIISMMKMVEEVAPECHARLPKRKTNGTYTWSALSMTKYITSIHLP